MSTGLGEFARNIRNLLPNLRDSVFRHGLPESDRSRSLAVFANLFLHLLPTRVHARTLRFSSTLCLGLISFFLFVILVVSGILLMVYYKPSVEHAYNSVTDIVHVVPGGLMARNVHRWAAHLMVLAVLLHMARVFFTASYKPRREINWLVGMGLLVLTLGLSFTGYLLPWDQLGFWAVMIGSNIAASPREITEALGLTHLFDPGGMQRELLLGSGEVGQEGLIRFYLLHVIVLPLVLTFLCGIHFWRIRKDGGLARPDEPDVNSDLQAAGAAPGEPAVAPSKSYGLMCIVRKREPATNLDPEKTVPTWPYFLRLALLVLMGTILVCVVLGMAFNAPLKSPANPMVPENPAKAPWYFLGLQEMVSYSAFMGGMGIPMIVLVGLALIPYLDRQRETPGIYCSGRPGVRVALTTALFAAGAAIVAVGIPVQFGWLRNWFPAIPQLVITFINPGTLLTGAYVGWSLYVAQRTSSTRMSAIALFTCFLVGFAILTYVGTYLRGPNWAFYWSSSHWPVH